MTAPPSLIDLPALLLVAVGGGLGAVLRYLAMRLIPATRFPLALLVVNALGSLLAGVLMGAAAAFGTVLTLALSAGFCGGLTTFSSFSTETVQLWQSGRARAAVAGAVANLTLGVGCAALGFGLALLVA